VTPTPEERALLAAVDAAPGDDVPRLVYADWLDEHGRPERAEFIRVQCALARLAVADREKHAALTRRQDELRAKPAAALLDLPAESVQVRWDRGFPDELTLHLNDFIQYGSAIATLVPRPRVTVTHVGANLGAFLVSPHVDCVTGMVVEDHEIDSVAFDGGLLAEFAPYLETAFARMAQVDTLNLSHCRLADTTLDLIFPPRAFPALEDLDLSHNWLTDDGVVRLLNAGVLQRLRQLNLAGNPVGDQAAFELADRLGPDNRLDRLDVRETEITADGQRALTHRFGPAVLF
jgi:uncharacterized protein (TIGR02996 family)